MKKNIKIFLGFIFFISTVNYNKYVTYDSNKPSQLGDRLLEYSIAKWISWKYKIPFFYQPFLYSNLFNLHENFNESLLKIYKENKIRLKYFSEDSFDKETLYMVRLNYSHDITWNYDDLINKFIITESLSVNPNLSQTFEYEGKEKGGYFDYLFIASRKNPDFLKELRKLISPKKKITYLKLPKNKISVAIHIRCGEKFEKYSQYFSLVSLKMPPLDFYIDQLKKLSIFLDNAPLFVYIFTNHSDPLILLQTIKNKLVKFNNITFASRSKNNQEDTFIEDLFFMSKFDCLIRPRSSFSMTAQLIGNHKIILYPKRGFRKNENLYIDKIGMIIIDQILTSLNKYKLT